MFGVGGEGWLDRILDEVDSALIGLFFDNRDDVRLVPSLPVVSGRLWIALLAVHLLIRTGYPV
ncbi:hypothetical protein [Photorhabdus temperata]|uniref:hypothetical protein n=1 Tax=Photorhabdus temperata TaxID=574560 RepID=UPI00040C4879|nr:hypothetical protein [Photorhabdus temperata]